MTNIVFFESRGGQPVMRPATRTDDGIAEAPSARHDGGTAARILFVGESVCLAHVGRPALLARWAREAGHDVAFACGPAFAGAAREEGLDPIPLQTIDLKILYRRLDEGRFFYARENLDAYVEAERALLARVKPDLVVGDFRLTLSVSAALAGVPMLSLINAHWSPGHPCRFPAPRAGIFRRLPLALREPLFALGRPLGYGLFARPLDNLRRRHGLAPLGDLRELYTAGDYCAYLDLPELVPLRRVPAGHFYLGPLAWTPRAARPVRLDGLDPRRPLAYVSMGSSGDEGLLPGVLGALAAAGFNVVLSGIEHARAEAWRQSVPGLNGRLLAARRMDPGPALARAAVTVCHGGSGTVYQSLARGVPVLSLPHNPDQGLVAQSVEAAGAGRTLHPDRFRTGTFKEMVTIHLNGGRGGLSRRAGALSMSIGAWDVRGRWSRWLAAFAARLDAGRSHSRAARSARQIGMADAALAGRMAAGRR
jgi:UDP:flavonoid glycosyltransferase YjiC (YdhE family)